MTLNFSLNYPQVARDAGFKLRQFKDGPLDWHLIGSLEIERVLRDQSLEKLDSVLLHLSEAPLGTILETNVLDSGIAKYFMLSQFSIQYLYFCRKFLDETVRDLKEALRASEGAVAKLQKSLTEANNEMLQIHRRMTQMEALHEVVYPCHLCTKNFISNDALNIHLDRKHTAKVVSAEKRPGTPDDLTLINTIKLELEVKQLKERLNSAEKEIRDRSVLSKKEQTPIKEGERDRSVLSKKEQTPIKEGEEPMKLTKNVAIQSNLAEMKEKDDSNDLQDKLLMEQREGLAKLQDKMQEFEAWQKAQKANNEECIAEINKKLGNIVQSLDDTKTLRSPLEETAPIMTKAISPSVEDLERLLTQKVAEIGKASTEKLEEVVHHMETNYSEKLDELKRQMEKKQFSGHIKHVGNTKTGHEEDSSETESSEAEKKTRVKREQTVPVSVVTAVEERKVKSKISNENDAKEADRLKEERMRKELTGRSYHKSESVEKIAELVESVSSESNRTFVKTVTAKEPIEVSDATQIIAVHDDVTDISDSLSDESPSEDNSSDAEIPPKVESSNKQPPSSMINAAKKEVVNVDKKMEAQKTRSELKPKQFTRKDAKKLANSRLLTVGLDIKTKSISTAAMKRITEDYTEKRNKLKQKYPHFNMTRNKFKKFVDKLCSARLPPDAETILKSTQLLRPTESNAKIRGKETQISSFSSFENLEADASTPLQTSPNESDAFKQRLERILASPMRRPDTKESTAEVNINRLRSTSQQPVPMPRKRVMFNTRPDPKQSEDSAASDEPEENRISKFPPRTQLNSLRLL